MIVFLGREAFEHAEQNRTWRMTKAGDIFGRLMEMVCQKRPTW